MVKIRSVALLTAVGLAVVSPTVPARAQDSSDPNERMAEANEGYVEYWRSVATDPDRTAEERADAWQKIYDQENRHASDQTRTGGAAQHVERVGEMMEHEEASNEIDLERQRLENERLKAQIEREKAEAEAAKPPGFWDKIGDALLRVGESLLSNAGNQFVENLMNPDSGADNQAMLDELARLQEEYDRLNNERNDTGDGLGRVITDPTGSYGYDRDGDGYVDIPINSDGTVGDYDPTNDYGYGNDSGSGSTSDDDGSGGLITDANGTYGYDSNGDGLVDAPLPNPLGSGYAGGGGPSFGGGMGAGGGGMPGMPGAGGVAANAAEDEASAEDEDGIPGVGGTSSEAANGLAAAGGGATVGDGVLGAANEKDLITAMGRVMIFPKLEFEDLAGDRKPEAGAWEDEWADDGWDDATDNGDWGDDWADDGWGDDEWSDDEWGAEAPAGEGAQGAKDGAEADLAAELVDQIIRVETVIAEWRKQEKEGKAFGAEDPYGFQDETTMSGYRAAGADGEDPFKDVRDEDGKIDLTKVDLWVISRDTWKEGNEPVRYKVKLGPEVTDLEPVHGGVLVVRAVEHEIDVEQRVIDEIKGDVKELEVVQVILSAEKPPADMESLDPAAAPADGDAGVGGLTEDELGTIEDGGW